MNRITKSSILAGLFVLLFSAMTFSQTSAEQVLPENMSLSFNGKFVTQAQDAGSQASSPDGIYRCYYDIGAVSDEMRELINFRFYENDRLLFSLDRVPGSDLYISNSGFVAFMDMEFHFKKQLTLHFYNQNGQPQFSETFVGASLFGFSRTGNLFGVGNGKGLQTISLLNHKINFYEPADQFDISDDENWIAIARGEIVKIYKNGEVVNEFNTGFLYPRKICISAQHQFVALIDKRNLNVYSSIEKKQIFSEKLSGKYSFRDLLLQDDKIIAGVHYRSNGVSKGILKVFNLSGEQLFEQDDTAKLYPIFEKIQITKKSSCEYETLPWPFEPFDQMHTVWNYYEQHMGGYGSDFSYLHQGLDIIVPIAEPTYAVKDGVVKCVLTLGGAIYWRLAVADEQVSQPSDGWLYAHLIESSIQFDVGDSVRVHDYLGNIIQWSNDWGHIHFVQIRDSGLVWRYDDNEWGINYNPLLSLQPNTDLIPPKIEPVFSNSKFGFCLNESSNYLDPDSLFGDVDIIVKVRDFIGDSPWEQPAFETYYWAKKMPEGEIVFPRTLGQRLNHSYNLYASTHYEPYATVLYKRDELLVASSWMGMIRNYYHILTNNNGDSLVTISEKYRAFCTTDYLDGDYRVFVEARDEYGNSTSDSLDVKFCNGLTRVTETEVSPTKFSLRQNQPNPFNPETQIRYQLPEAAHVKLEIYNLLGQKIITLKNELQPAGSFSVIWDGRNLSGEQVVSGIYLYRLTAGDFCETKKMILLR